MPILRSALKAKREKLEAYEALCAKLGEEPAHVGLAWLLHQPGVTAPIIGPRTMEQMTGSLRALEIKLDAETLAAFDKIFPDRGRRRRRIPGSSEVAPPLSPSGGCFFCREIKAYCIRR